MALPLSSNSDSLFPYILGRPTIPKSATKLDYTAIAVSQSLLRSPDSLTPNLGVSRQGYCRTQCVLSVVIRVAHSQWFLERGRDILPLYVGHPRVHFYAFPLTLQGESSRWVLNCAPMQPIQELRSVWVVQK